MAHRDIFNGRAAVDVRENMHFVSSRSEIPAKLKNIAADSAGFIYHSANKANSHPKTSQEEAA
jgi:hypothetical protein